MLYEGMSKTSPWAALYFIALMTFGNYVLFNLLVAILVEGFSSAAEVSTTLVHRSILLDPTQHPKRHPNPFTGVATAHMCGQTDGPRESPVA